MRTSRMRLVYSLALCLVIILGLGALLSAHLRTNGGAVSSSLRGVAHAERYVMAAIRLTGTELLQQKMKLMVRVDRDPAGRVVVSFRRRPWGSGGKPGRMLGGTVRVAFSEDRVTLEPASALMSPDEGMRRDYRLTEVVCLALSSLPSDYPGDEFEMDVYPGEPKEYLVLVMPLPGVPGSHRLVSIIDDAGKLRLGTVISGM